MRETASSPFKVVHLGQHAAILGLTEDDGLLVCTDRRRGLVPGGLSMSSDEYRTLRQRLSALTGPARFAALERMQVSHINLRLKQHPHPAALRRTLADVLGEPIPHPGIDVPRSLIGWGRGATPAGDDILVGALAGHILNGRPEEHQALAAAIQPLLSRTTRASRHDLAAACQGFFCERLHQLVAAADRQDLAAATELISDWGASSGRDLTTGLLAVLPRKALT
ncbi:MAG: DUF2877 domain-containing protein [Brooklawnia sp.]